MRRLAKSVVELGIAYIFAVIVLEFFLAHYEILILPILGVVFIFFSLLIFNTLLPLAVKSEVGRAQIREKGEDELQRLERLVRRAMQDHDSEAADALRERLRLLALQIASYRTEAPLSQLDEESEDRTFLLSQIIQDEPMVRLLTSGPNASAPTGAREIEAVLSTLEGWVA